MLAMVYENTFSTWLNKAMEERGMTQAELARQAGVTRAAINNILQGSRGPGVDLCNGIARALKLPPEDVYRMAGLLPPEPEPDDKTLYKIQTLYHTLREDQNKQKALEFLEFLSGLEDKDDRKGKKPKSKK